MILVRHGQTIFNVVYGSTRQDPGVADPELTEEGRGQADAAADSLARHGIELVIASPYRRALQTARIIAGTLGVAVLIDERARERCAFSCDVGSPRSHLARTWPELDFSALAETWRPKDEGARGAVRPALRDLRDPLVGRSALGSHRGNHPLGGDPRAHRPACGQWQPDPACAALGVRFRRQAGSRGCLAR